MLTVHPLFYSSALKQQQDFLSSYHEEIPEDLRVLEDRKAFSTRVVQIVDDVLCSPGYLMVDRVRTLFGMISHPYILYQHDPFHPRNVLYKLCVIDDELKDPCGLKPVELHSTNEALLIHGKVQGVQTPLFVFKKEGNAFEHEAFAIPENGGPVRELLAYLFDYDHKAKVPRTVLMYHPKLGRGSFQEYQADYSSKSSNVFLQTLSIRHLTERIFEQIRFMALHQYIIVNMDPHCNNFLTYLSHDLNNLNAPYFVPIDFSYSLPFDFRRLPSNTYLLDFPVFVDVLKKSFSEAEKAWVDQVYSQRFSYLNKHEIDDRTIEITRTAFLILQEAIQRSMQDRQNGAPFSLTLHDLMIMKHTDVSTHICPAFNPFYSVSEFQEICSGKKEDRRDRIQECFTRILERKKATALHTLYT